MEWYEFPENIRFLAQWLASEGADGWTIYDVFETPWDFTDDYNRALGESADHAINRFGL